jgi:hypothetical protein
MRNSIFAVMKIETTDPVCKNLPQITLKSAEINTNCKNFSNILRYLQEKYATELLLKI